MAKKILDYASADEKGYSDANMRLFLSAFAAICGLLLIACFYVGQTMGILVAPLLLISALGALASIVMCIPMGWNGIGGWRGAASLVFTLVAAICVCYFLHLMHEGLR